MSRSLGELSTAILCISLFAVLTWIVLVARRRAHSRYRLYFSSALFTGRAATPRPVTDGGRSSRGWSPIGVLRIGFGLLGVVLVGLALAVLFRPTLLPLDTVQLPEDLYRFRNRALLALGVVAIVGGAGIYLGRHVLGLSQSSPNTERTRAVPYPPELVRTPRTDRVGQHFDEQLSTLENSKTAAAESLETELAELAVALFVEYDDTDRADARARLAAGDWTDDPRAAAFLGEDAPSLHWRVELWDWLRPMPRFERRVRHTVDALEAYVAAQSEGGRDR